MRIFVSIGSVSAHRSASTWRSQRVNRFELVKMRLTTFYQ
jgi:hypothetical protein